MSKPGKSASDNATTATSASTATMSLAQRRRRAVEMRLAGQRLADIAATVNLSNPTIISAHKAYLNGGWAAVDTRAPGRSAGTRRINANDAAAIAATLISLRPETAKGSGPSLETETSAPWLWDFDLLSQWLQSAGYAAVTRRTAAQYARDWQLVAENPKTLHGGAGAAKEAIKSARQAGLSAYWAGVNRINTGTLFYAYSTRGQYTWLTVAGNASESDYKDFFERLGKHAQAPVLILVRGVDHSVGERLQTGLADAGHQLYRLAAETSTGHRSRQQATTPSTPAALPKPKILTPHLPRPLPASASTSRSGGPSNSNKGSSMRVPGSAQRIDTSDHLPGSTAERREVTRLTHLQRLEAEAIHILREVIAEAERPVMLYSVGKDSAVLLHLAAKAFYPAPLPLPLLHVDTTWKFREMYEFRDKTVNDLGIELLTHVNPEGLDQGVNPFTHGSALHTDIMKTQALKQALEQHGFDVALGGARRDEEASRAKERVFSFRTRQHRWDPKAQRPELWRLYNTRKAANESMRVFPLSNWTELDIWQYIEQENIPVVPLYFAAERPVVERDNRLIMVDDDRLPLSEGEAPMMRRVRFRTLGCYPLTGAIESAATTVNEIIRETLLSESSERVGRTIDHDSAASMEKKKQEGYF